ncbi:MAG: hypothetical protein IJZ59_01785 [Alphaproteobacteria bacterium]|nr:hypothetical protein [Alphaproteobacteria bacterium]
MIQKAKNLANEWHLFTTAAVETITKYVTAHGVSDELRNKLTGNKVGKVTCSFAADGSVKVVSKSRSSEKRRTLERDRARRAKLALAMAS